MGMMVTDLTTMTSDVRTMDKNLATMVIYILRKGNDVRTSVTDIEVANGGDGA